MSDRLDKKIKERYTKYVLPSIKEARYRKNSETKYYDYQISEDALLTSCKRLLYPWAYS